MNKIIRCGISLMLVVSLLCACQATAAPAVSNSELAVSSVLAAESQARAEDAAISGKLSSSPSAPSPRKSSNRISSICRTFSSPMPRMR